MSGAFSWKSAMAQALLTILVAAPTVSAEEAARQLAETDKRSYCSRYVRTAIHQNAQNQRYECGKGGNRWSSNHGDHFKWCMAVQPAHAERETQIRDEELEGCMFQSERVLGLQGAGSARAKYCRSYAATAIRNVREARRLGCRFNGARWSNSYDGHYGWCYKANSESTLAESGARSHQLSGCRSARRP